MSGPIPLASRPADDVPKELAQELDAVASRVRDRLKGVTENIINVGRELRTVKDQLKHGQFIDWVENACGLSRRTAQLMIRAAQWAEGKSETVSLLESTTIYLLAAPSTPETVADAVLSRADAGEVIPPHIVKDMIRAEKQAQAKEGAGSTPAGTRRHAQHGAPQAARAKDAVGDCSLDALMAAWTHAGEEARASFLQQIGASLTARADIPGQIEANAGPPPIDRTNTLSEPLGSDDEAGESLERECPNTVKAETDRLIEIFEGLGPNSQKWARWWAPAGAPSEDTSHELVRTTEVRAPFRAAYPNASPISQAAFLQYLEGRSELV